ncbi:MAG: tRNA (adenosine(37)-N6)-threonylcarbamoyltransferase complex dimerization subunit type 1 TsaB [Myxococcales bacterium]|nr:tRNA (adenosine(37)-N6)-threonylcarbamoyltransferase complex dimerization subunit type 1 TsaB [Myxococcales bacterium]
MLILAIETSSERTAVAIARGAEILAENDAASPERHGELLLPRIGELLTEAGVGFSDLEAIAVGLGPGSFTGLRVGLATAKGLAVAAGLPLRGVGSLPVLARGAGEAGQTVVTVGDAQRGEVFAAAYRVRDQGPVEVLLSPFHTTPEAAGEQIVAALGGGLLCGAGLRRYPGLLEALPAGRFVRTDPDHDFPRGRHLCREARALLALEGPSDLATLEPSYLRGSDAKLPDRPLKLERQSD